MTFLKMCDIMSYVEAVARNRIGEPHAPTTPKLARLDSDKSLELVGALL